MANTKRPGAATPAQFVTLREAARLTQVEAAKRLGVSRATIQNWERGDTPIPQMAVDAIRAATVSR